MEIECVFILFLLKFQIHTLSPVPPIFIGKDAIRNVLDKSKTFRAQLYRKLTIGGCIGASICIAMAVINLRFR